MGSIPPYGYYLYEGKLVLRNDYTTDVVCDIFEKFLEGWGHDKIARYLSKMGIPTPATIAGKSNAGLYWQGASIGKIYIIPTM